MAPTLSFGFLLVPALAVFLAIAVLMVVALVLGTAARSRRSGDFENNPLSVSNGVAPHSTTHQHPPTSPLLLYEMHNAATSAAHASTAMGHATSASHHASTIAHPPTTMPTSDFSSSGGHHGH